MVLFSDKANNDLDNILLGMLNWEKMTLSFEHISNYISDIINVCDHLDKKSIMLIPFMRFTNDLEVKSINIAGIKIQPGISFTIIINKKI